MNPPSLDIAGYLSSQGVGTLHAKTNWGIHVGQEPASSPDNDVSRNMITVYDTTGTELDTDELDVWRPSIQVRVRGEDYVAVYQKQEEIVAALVHDPITAETSVFSLIVLSSDILALGQDENGNHLMTTNYRCRRTEKES